MPTLFKRLCGQPDRPTTPEQCGRVTQQYTPSLTDARYLLKLGRDHYVFAI